MYELNNMINTLAPAHITQLNKKNAPWVDTDTYKQIQLRAQHYRTAIQTNNTDDWRQYRHTNNITNTLIKKRKIAYYSYKFDTNNTPHNAMWPTLKNLTNTNKQNAPTTLIHNSTFVSSPRAIASIANTHYINKINTIRNSFKKLTLNPMHILSTLIPRQQHTMHIPHITLAQTLEMIDTAPSSHSTGHDDITMNHIKTMKHSIAPHITHLINTILDTSTFPNTFKHSHITPIFKPKKAPTSIDSYRPINNLCTLEKLVEQHIKTHLDTFLDKHNIIHPHHHGGRKQHSTTTALAHTT